MECNTCQVCMMKLKARRTSISTMAPRNAGDEAANVKARNEGAGQQQDDGIDDQEEKAQGQNAEREGQQL